MTDEATLAALRLADSSLPIGSNALSYGLEQFVQDDRIEDAAELRALLETYLTRVVGPADLVALRAAHAAGLDADLAGVAEADRRLHATTLPAELRESSTGAGDRLLSLQREVTDDPLVEEYAERDAPGNHAVVLGLVAAREGVDARGACLAHCHAFVTGLLGAAQRLLVLGATEIQGLLVELRPTMTAAVERSADRSLDEMAPFAPLVDVLSAEHERADRRLFRS